jgi:thioredoxin reductase (NADPH)
VQNVKTGENSELQTDAVFPYIGYSPNTELFIDQIKLDSKGFIETDINLATSCEGVFAAGDVRVSPLRQVVISAADGAISATSAVKYLEEKQAIHV